ncbi:hypothetical protein [Staphylococcus cohnii]|uniref:hypothetical protein n=1 Tax=Staphylococcus cohnii TaxID=29382 RepID=UPI001105DA6C|nr:hypothetical protein [Staphylococcus cohnii]TLW35963.1 hypothetical protein FFX88_08675 [Staphylococcus cohnii]
MELNEITQRLKSIEDDAHRILNENSKLKAENVNLKELARAQQDRLNNIYEASAKAQYEADLWRKRFEAVESYVALKLEMTPGSDQYRKVAIQIKEQMKKDLHELY